MLFISIISTDRTLFGEIRTVHEKAFTALSLKNEMYMLYSRAEIILQDIYLRWQKCTLMMTAEYNISHSTVLNLRDVLPPVDLCSVILSAECCFLFQLSPEEKMQNCKRTHKSNCTYEKKPKKLGFSLLTDKVMKYLVLVRLLYPIRLSDEVSWPNIFTELLNTQ